MTRNLVLAYCVATFFFSAALWGASTPAALTGIVSSEAEKTMEGVVVSAKRIGGTITVSVDSDETGRFAFPADRLAPGRYQISIRAIGYEVADPKLEAAVGKGITEKDIKLDKTRDLASQLSSTEWLMSIPGTSQQKEKLYKDCVWCHTLTPVMKSTYNAAEWKTTLVRMHNWSEAGALYKPVPSPTHVGPQPGDEEFAQYLSSINLSSKPAHDFELKTLPRPHGNETKVIITEYDLPRKNSEPHEAVPDKDGMVWYSDYAEGILGRLNPRTGEVKEWVDSLVKPGYPPGFHDLELDKEGNPWLGRHEFNGFSKFDKKTEKFVDWSLPEGVSPNVRPTFIAIRPDGKVWVKDNPDHKVFAFDPTTGKFVGYDQFPPGTTFPPSSRSPHQIYGMNADSLGNEYGADIDKSNIARVDAETGKATLYPTPTPNSDPRRMHFDAQDRLYIGEWASNRLAVFDTKTEKFQEWPVPIPWYGPYDVAPDKNGYMWTGTMSLDLITRFNPKTGEFTNYLMPLLGVNVRRVEIDNRSTPPVFWVGENRQAKIAKVETIE